MEVNRIGLTDAQLVGIIRNRIGPEVPLLESELGQVILEKVAQIIYANNEKITQDLYKAGIIIPD